MTCLARWFLLLALPCSGLVAATPASEKKKASSKTAAKPAAKPKPKSAPDLDEEDATAPKSSSSKVEPKTGEEKTSPKKTKPDSETDDEAKPKSAGTSKAKTKAAPEDTEAKPKTAGQGTKADGPAQSSKPKPAAKGQTAKKAAASKSKTKPAIEDDDAPPKDKALDATPAPAKATASAKGKPPVIDHSGDPVGERSRVTGPNATISTDELFNFSANPAPVQNLLRLGLALTERDLTYRYGSADPATGGMDCSGTVYYLLRAAGVKDVPRDSSSLYLWARDAGTLRTVNATSLGDPQFEALEPGDLLFWEGTYVTNRNPPISHTMIYLGREKKTGERVMVGASDGRSYRGIRRNGVSVFDFKLPKADSTARFVGFARVPGL